ncbi:MAG: ferrous iron transport protein A [Bacteroidales bacterium]|nr:ferrous iron transport protein A [Bacteroidales bacterium]
MNQEMEDRNVPWSTIPAGQRVGLARIDAGQELTARLLAMGLTAQVEIDVISNQAPGPLVVCVRDNKMVLGRGMAEKITVYPLSTCPE